MTASLDRTQFVLNSLSPNGAEAVDERPALSLFVVGYPSYLGGADTELWHTIKLWRRKGISVNLIPTWHAQPEWREKLSAIGATTYEVGDPHKLTEVPGLAGSPVVSFCNGEFLLHVDKFRDLGCPIVWANCMTWLFPKEIEHYEQRGAFEAYLFQSAFQRSCLLPTLREYGVRDDQCFQIPGAFAVEEFPFHPSSHRPGEPFIFGRIARPDLDKWSSNLWPIYRSVQYSHKRARVMAWDNRLTQKCGQPPEWAEPLAANAEPSRKFLESLHCMFPINGGARENWPRSGLEAMGGLGQPRLVRPRGRQARGTRGFVWLGSANQLGGLTGYRLPAASCFLTAAESFLANCLTCFSLLREGNCCTLAASPIRPACSSPTVSSKSVFSSNWPVSAI